MVKKNVEDKLTDTKNWDYEHLEIKEPVKSPRVVVSVAFSHNDFSTVSICAKKTGKKTSEFIREAALEKAKQQKIEIIVSDFGSTGSLWFDRYLPSSTQTNILVKEHGINEYVLTQ